MRAFTGRNGAIALKEPTAVTGDLEPSMLTIDQCQSEYATPMAGVIFVGIQGSGKSTFFKERLANMHVRLSLAVNRDCTPPAVNP